MGAIRFANFYDNHFVSTCNKVIYASVFIVYTQKVLNLSFNVTFECAHVNVCVRSAFVWSTLHIII